MTSFFITLFRFVFSFIRGLRDTEFRTLFITLLALLVSGTIFYSTAEGWNIVDSIYFCIMTLSTVGYGDLHPTTTFSKIFTIIYIVVGAGIFIGFITKVAEQRHHGKKNKIDSEK